MTGRIVVSAFYKFVELSDYRDLCKRLHNVCEAVGMRGSILLASEGINGAIAGDRAATDQVLGWLRSDARFADLSTKESFADVAPFLRMKVRGKREIVTFRQEVDPTHTVGTYVAPTDWNQVISDPDVLVIDTRNAEEVALGTFEGAVNPGTTSFTEFADYATTLDPSSQPKVAMFCTGGIRCEKATSYLLDQGFEDVMHLEGGILQYLNDVPQAESLWRGECFVFDERVTVDHDLRRGSYELCRGCRSPVSEIERQDPAFESGVSCRLCFDALTPDKRARLRERHHQVTLAEQRGEVHIARRF